MTAPLVRCVGAGLTYGAGVTALAEVDCLVEAGDQVAVMGPSGSGKSSLLHVFAGLVRVTSGDVSWNGLEGSPRDPERVGLIFQEPALVPALTVLENVALPLTFAGMPVVEAAERGRDALDLVGVANLGDALPQEVSGGQAQRAVIARVVACRPRLILADEPTSKLDRATAGRIIDVLLRVSDDLGAALVIATHDPAVGGSLEARWQVEDGRLRSQAITL
ncbi:ABC transporter ATP-binding protein [Cryptosporangium phraense]|uniref:ATP-binding cassette domain-containing protein n=1 Tax=Cryptosporangium phraense TaxID=2593070 RepID=A0A545AVE2_9ACTN|nr:ATP-binding cassette domain-containing protein [Cryptosporangium phraense]TQS45309.1 ATP-binding cassette domain-containing protein [Cryptosporangium phraense]